MMTNSPLNEYTLAIRARAGDREALTELILRLRSRLFAIAYAELRHYADAQDAVASGLLQICRTIGDLREPERVVAWMQTIIRNEAHRLRRRENVAVMLSADAPYEDQEVFLLRLDIERALQQIPTMQAETVRLFYFEGQSVQTIAEEKQVSSTVVRMWLHRGRRHLRTALKEYEPKMTANKTASPLRKVAVVHGDLADTLRQRMTNALVTAGYAPAFLTLADLGELGSDQPGPWDILREYDALVLVEPLGRRSVFEYILLLRSASETAEMPVAIVLEESRPDTLRALALHTLGVVGLASTAEPESLDYLFRWTGDNDLSQETRRVILFADDAARRAGQNAIGIEHLLSGLLREESVVRYLRETAQIAPEQMLASIPQEREGEEVTTVGAWRSLTPENQKVLAAAHTEAGGSHMTPLHLLKAILQTYNTAS